MYGKKGHIKAVVIILVVSAFTRECQGQKYFELDNDDSDSDKTKDTSSDSKENTGLDIDSTILVNSKDIEKSSSDEVIKDDQKNNNYKNLTLKNILSTNDEEIVRGNIKKLHNEDVTPNFKQMATTSSDSKQKEGIVLGGIKLNPNEYVTSKYTGVTAKRDINLEGIKLSTVEDKVIRGKLRAESDERVPLTHHNIDAHTHAKLEDTKHLNKEYEVIRGNPKSEIDEQTQINRENLIAINHDLKNSEESIEDEERVHDNETKSNYSKDVVAVQGKRSNSTKNIVVKFITTDDHLILNKDRKPISNQGTTSMTEKDGENPVPKWSSSEDHKILLKDIKKARALRTVFADMCSRVIIRKCLKAMKMTLKNICSKEKCKTGFHDDFRENAINACYMVFGKTTSFRAGYENPMGEEQHDSWQCATCLQDSEETKSVLRSQTVDAVTKNVNILRDRYEKQCIKTSYMKCLAAGKYARNKTCTKYECIPAKKKGIKKMYKKNCRGIFRYREKE